MSLYKWVREGKQDLVPAFSTHIIGCGGVIIRDDKIMLVEKKSVRFGIFLGSSQRKVRNSRRKSRPLVMHSEVYLKRSF